MRERGVGVKGGVSVCQIQMVVHFTCPEVPCVLCDAVYQEMFISVRLSLGGEEIGDICPRCLSTQPQSSVGTLRQRGAVLIEQASRLLAQTARLANQARRMVDSSKELQEKHARDRKQRAIDRYRRMLPGGAAPQASRVRDSTPPSSDEQGMWLLDLAGHLEGVTDWGLTIKDVQEAEKGLCRKWLPALDEAALRSLVDDRYRHFLTGTY